MFSKFTIALIIFIPCALVAIPAWFLMRFLNDRAEKRRLREQEEADRHWEAQMASVRAEIKSREPYKRLR